MSGAVIASIAIVGLTVAGAVSDWSSARYRNTVRHLQGEEALDSMTLWRGVRDAWRLLAVAAIGLLAIWSPA